MKRVDVIRMGITVGTLILAFYSSNFVGGAIVLGCNSSVQERCLSACIVAFILILLKNENERLDDEDDDNYIHGVLALCETSLVTHEACEMNKNV